MQSSRSGNQEIMERLLANQRAQILQELRAARASANQGQVDQVVQRLQRLAKFVGASKLGNEDRQKTREEALKIQRDAYKKHVDTLLNEAISAARQGDKDKRGEWLKKAREALSKAMVVGVEPEFADQFEKRCQIVLETQPQGTSEKARIDKDTEWANRSRPDDLKGEKAKRRHLRFETPKLTVTMAGRGFTTVNWALGGMRIAGETEGLRLGTTLDVTVKAEGLEETFTEQLTLLRFEPSQNAVAGRFQTTDNKIVVLIGKLRKAGMEPY